MSLLMTDPPFQPIVVEERKLAAAIEEKIEFVLAELSKDCHELTAESARGKMDGVQQGISKVRDVVTALKSLNQTLQKR
jgi:hypothetical protein